MTGGWPRERSKRVRRLRTPGSGSGQRGSLATAVALGEESRQQAVPRTLTCARPSGQPATYLHSTTREALGHPYLSGACRPRRGPAAFPPPGGGSRDLFVLPEQTDSRYDPIPTLRKPGEGTRERVCRALTTVVST